MSAGTVLIHVQTPPGAILTTQAAPHTRRSGCVGTSFQKVGPRACALSTGLRINSRHSVVRGKPSQITLGHSPAVSRALLRPNAGNSEHGTEAPATLMSLDKAFSVPAQNSIYHEMQNSSLGETCIMSASGQLCPVRWEGTCMEDRDN